MQIPISSIVIALLVVGAAPPAEAGKLSGVTLPDTVDVAGKRLHLNGMGLREATMFKVNVYVAGLYLENVSSNPGAIVGTSQVKRLVLRFVRDVDRGDIVKAWSDGFKYNSTVKQSSIQGLIDRLNGWMVDFSKGDTLTFTCVPGEGVTVEINGAVKGTLKNEDFVRSLISIWLGPKPPTAALKRGILGKHGAGA